jgi:uncharacterized protein YbjT (DUF2867 family)
MTRVLVVGATGRQGGSVVDALLAPLPTETDAVAALDPTVLGLTRDAGSDAARGLADRGVTLVEADLGAPDSLAAAVAEAAPDAVFGYTVGMGRADEREQGRNLVDAVAATDARLVLSTGGFCDDRPGVEHVDAKADVEEYCHERLPTDRVTVLRPHTFTSNFERQRPALAAGRLPYPLAPGARLTLVDPRDVGRLAVRALADPARFAGETFELAGEALTLPEMAEAFAAVVGHAVEPVHVTPAEFVERMGAPPSFARFLEWQGEPHPTDADRLRESFDFETGTLRAYLERAW